MRCYAYASISASTGLSIVVFLLALFKLSVIPPDKLNIPHTRRRGTFSDPLLYLLNLVSTHSKRLLLK